MSGLVAALATLACSMGFAAAPATPAAADTSAVGESGWSVSLSFPDMQWSSTSCQSLPVTAVVTGPDVESWTFGGFVNPAGDQDDYDERVYAWYLDYDAMRRDGTGSFTFRHAVMPCPGYDWSGPFDVVGEVGVMRAGAAGWSWLPYRARFTVSGIPTTTTLEGITVGSESATFVGRTTASPSSASFHACGGGGVSVERSTGEGWEDIGYSDVGADGSFVVSVPTYRLTGTQYRATFGGGTTCAQSSSEARALPVRLPTAKVEAVSQQSKLRVDIDPDRGKRS